MLAVGAHVVPRVTSRHRRNGEAALEQKSWCSGFQSVVFFTDGHCHHLVPVPVKKLAAVLGPDWFGASVGRNWVPANQIWKWLYIYLKPVSVVCCIGQPSPVGRHRRRTHLVLSLQERTQCSFIGHLKSPDVACIGRHRDKRVAFRGPSSEMEMPV